MMSDNGATRIPDTAKPTIMDDVPTPYTRGITLGWNHCMMRGAVAGKNRAMPRLYTTRKPISPSKLGERAVKVAAPIIKRLIV